jgi:hypothetical protein
MSDDEAQQRLLLLTAALFAVRLFRREDEASSAFLPGGEDLVRAEAAERSARDAAAILAAVGKVWV